MKLSLPDRMDYRRLKDIVTKGLATVFEVGRALTEIKNRELWKSDHETWADFLKQVGISERYERELRQYWHLYDHEQLQIATGELDPKAAPISQAKTVRQVQRIVRRQSHVKSTGDASPVSETTPSENKKDSSPKSTQVDALGVLVPEELEELWKRGPQVQELIDGAHHIKRVLTEAQMNQDMLWAETEINSVLVSLRDVITGLKTALPHAVCPYCQGVLRKNCDFCYHRGLVSKWRLSTADQDLVKLQMKKKV